MTMTCLKLYESQAILYHWLCEWSQQLGDLNNKLVQYPDHGHVSDTQMIHYLNGT